MIVQATVPQTMGPAMAAMWHMGLSQGNKSRKHLAEHKDRAVETLSSVKENSPRLQIKNENNYHLFLFMLFIDMYLQSVLFIVHQ